jgi:integrase
VLSRSEVRALLGELRGSMWIIGALLYGSGLRLHECLERRVKDIDVERNQVVVRRGKGQKDRVTPLPAFRRRGSAGTPGGGLHRDSISMILRFNVR